MSENYLTQNIKNVKIIIRKNFPNYGIWPWAKFHTQIACVVPDLQPALLCGSQTHSIYKIYREVAMHAANAINLSHLHF